MEEAESDFDEANCKYVTKDNWRDFLKPIVLDDDEYGEEMIKDEETGVVRKKVIQQPNERLEKFDPIPSD